MAYASEYKEKISELPTEGHYVLLTEGIYYEHDYYGGSPYARPYIIHRTYTDRQKWLDAINEEALTKKPYKAYKATVAKVTVVTSVILE